MQLYIIEGIVFKITRLPLLNYDTTVSLVANLSRHKHYISCLLDQDAGIFHDPVKLVARSDQNSIRTSDIMLIMMGRSVVMLSIKDKSGSRPHMLCIYTPLSPESEFLDMIRSQGIEVSSHTADIYYSERSIWYKVKQLEPIEGVPELFWPFLQDIDYPHMRYTAYEALTSNISYPLDIDKIETVLLTSTKKVKVIKNGRVKRNRIAYDIVVQDTGNSYILLSE